jgi:hypothetical protein
MKVKKNKKIVERIHNQSPDSVGVVQFVLATASPRCASGNPIAFRLGFLAWPVYFSR